MTKLHKRLIIALAFLTLLNLVVGDDWKSACLPVSMLVNMWLSAKETQLSKPSKIIGFALVVALMLLGRIPTWQTLSKHI